MENKSVIKLIASGDVGMNRQNLESMFDNIREELKSGDLVFGQLEPCLADVGSAACQCRLPMRGRPLAAKVIAEAGYDVMSFATNHCMDWGREAFYQTIDTLQQAGIKVAGVGKNISEARKPVIVDVKGTKIGFLAYCSILPQDYYATEDRPGCAPMRGLTVYEQVEHDQPGTPCRIHTFPRKDDLDALIRDIELLRPQVDVLCVSLHWGIHFVPAVLADYQRYVAHFAIDAGADIIIGHHTHILKPVEVYKGKVVIYSLANFALDPPNLFDEHLEEKHTHKELRELNQDWKGSKKIMPPDSYKSMLCEIKIEDKKITEVSFLPVQLDDDATPRIVKHDEPEFMEIVEYMREITRSQDLKTEYTVCGDSFRVI